MATIEITLSSFVSILALVSDVAGFQLLKLKFYLLSRWKPNLYLRGKAGTVFSLHITFLLPCTHTHTLTLTLSLNSTRTLSLALTFMLRAYECAPKT